MGFGTGVVVPGTGVSLQNRGHGFTLDARAARTSCAGGKRPFHTIIPGFLCDADGRPRMSFGVMGGNMQPQGHVQTLVRMLRPRPAAAGRVRRAALEGRDAAWRSTSSPRWRRRWSHGLRALGHQVGGHRSIRTWTSARASSSGACPTTRRDGYVAASDSRRDGQAVGF